MWRTAKSDVMAALLWRYWEIVVTFCSFQQWTRKGPVWGKWNEFSVHWFLSICSVCLSLFLVPCVFFCTSVFLYHMMLKIKMTGKLWWVILIFVGVPHPDFFFTSTRMIWGWFQIREVIHGRVQVIRNNANSAVHEFYFQQTFHLFQIFSQGIL